jgi:hypothetical protein
MTFRKLDLFPSSGERGKKTPTQLGPLERANLNHSKSPKKNSNPVLYTIVSTLQNLLNFQVHGTDTYPGIIINFTTFCDLLGILENIKHIVTC